MFEFGRDLRRLFAQARESEDLGWLELIGVDLLAKEARREAIDAGRVSCARPVPAWLRASALWREHARRTGRADSRARALDAAETAERAARSADDRAAAALSLALGHMTVFDLCGGAQSLERAEAQAAGAGSERLRGGLSAQVAAVQARLTLRRARLDGGLEALLDAAALMDAAVHGASGRPIAEVDELRLERAGLVLEAGIATRDARLLDQAGRELDALVRGASPDYRPLARARALSLCAAGLSALAALAGDEAARRQGRALFEAAADAFTPDHSPLDWVAAQAVRALFDAPSAEDCRRAVLLSEGQGLILGALAREREVERQVALAADDPPRLEALERTLRWRLARPATSDGPLDWVADQIGMARVAAARGSEAAGESRFALIEAAAVAREEGVPILADRADALTARLPIQV